MSSGLNPAGTLCLGSINTSIILIGNAIVINNTTATAEITINSEVYIGTGTQTNFTALIPSKAGLNPTGTLHIGTSNTSEVIMGLLKIDNTVVPPQVYINGIALPPGSGVENDSDKFEITTDINGTQDTIAAAGSGNLQFIKTVNNDTNLLVNSLDSSLITIMQSGVYEFTFNINIDDGINGESVDILLNTASEGFYNNITDTLLDEGTKIPDSNFGIAFNGSATTLSASNTFSVYVGTDSGANLTIGFTPFQDPDLDLHINKIGTSILIKRVGDYILPTPP